MATALRPQSNFVVLPHTPKETAYGTAVADGSILQMYALSEPTMAETVRNRIFDDEQIKGHEFAMDDTQMTILAQDVTLPVSFPASTEIAGLLFAQALGALATTGAADPFTHTITAQNGLTSDQLPSISIINGTRGQTASYKKYKGAIPNEVRFACENRGRSMISATYFTDGNEADASGFALPATLAVATPLWGKNATFKIANAGSALVDQSTLLRSFELTWNNNLSREDNRGMIAAGTNLTGLRFGTRQLTCTIKIWGSKGDAFYGTDFATDVLKDIELKITNGANDDITFNLDRCIIEAARDSFDDIRNVLELTIRPFTITSTGTSPVQILVRNGVSAYLA